MSNDEIMRQFQRILALYRRGLPSSEEASAAEQPTAGHHGTGRILSKLVGQGDGISQAALAEKINIRPQSLSEALAKMEERGWIDRRPNPQDKRGTLVYLTEEGRRQEEHLAARRRAAADHLFSALSEEEKELLSSMLSKILAENEVH